MLWPFLAAVVIIPALVRGCSDQDLERLQKCLQPLIDFSSNYSSSSSGDSGSKLDRTLFFDNQLVFMELHCKLVVQFGDCCGPVFDSCMSDANFDAVAGLLTPHKFTKDQSRVSMFELKAMSLKCSGYDGTRLTGLMRNLLNASTMVPKTGYVPEKLNFINNSYKTAKVIVQKMDIATRFIARNVAQYQCIVAAMYSKLVKNIDFNVDCQEYDYSAHESEALKNNLTCTLENIKGIKKCVSRFEYGMSCGLGEMEGYTGIYVFLTQDCKYWINEVFKAFPILDACLAANNMTSCTSMDNVSLILGPKAKMDRIIAFQLELEWLTFQFRNLTKESTKQLKCYYMWQEPIIYMEIESECMSNSDMSYKRGACEWKIYKRNCGAKVADFDCQITTKVVAWTFPTKADYSCDQVNHGTWKESFFNQTLTLFLYILIFYFDIHLF